MFKNIGNTEALQEILSGEALAAMDEVGGVEINTDAYYNDLVENFKTASTEDQQVAALKRIIDFVGVSEDTETGNYHMLELSHDWNVLYS